MGGRIGTKPIVSPKEIFKLEWDEVIIVSVTALYLIKEQLISYGVPDTAINSNYVEIQVKAREAFLENFAKIVCEQNIKGNVAEAGVFQGEFAKVINKIFYDRTIYLFDTFEGFDKKDIEYEKRYDFSKEQVGHLSMTSEELVMRKMQYPDKCIIRKGYFPETAFGIEDTFCFVNLDMDLYKPTLEGLKFFWERMELYGIILVHDYFSESYKGVKRAVDEFCRRKEIGLFPIGDSISIGLIRMK